MSKRFSFCTGAAIIFRLLTVAFHSLAFVRDYFLSLVSLHG
ncbi:MAG: hypothetical protein ABI707_16375 [Ferruginibacter sp.]